MANATQTTGSTTILDIYSGVTHTVPANTAVMVDHGAGLGDAETWPHTADADPDDYPTLVGCQPGDVVRVACPEDADEDGIPWYLSRVIEHHRAEEG